MSYLVDALKKAERERHVNQRADMRSLAEGEPPQQRVILSGRTLGWLVGVLVICNAALLAYLLLPAHTISGLLAPPQDVAAANDNEPRAAAGSAREPASDADSETSSIAPDARSNRETPSDPRSAPAGDDTRSSGAARDARAEARNPPPADRAREAGPSSLRRSGEQSQRRGRVTYAQSPLDGSATSQGEARPETPARRTAPAGSAADITINGHLFSTVPGRSFILVEGRRYHEGERLKAGPAVERIDETGATLNDHGERYHVDGPR